MLKPVPMSVLLVDDEPLARVRMKTLLRGHESVVVIGECGSGEEARRLMASTPPDVVFVDVRMPGMGGIELARVVGQGRRPLVVLVTAHSEFALEAFECRAVDYLLKPVRPERLAQALERLRDLLCAPDPSAETEAPTSAVTTLMVRNGGAIALIPAHEVEWIESAGNYLVIQAGAARHVLRGTLSEMESRLDPRRFVRLSRSIVANSAFIDRLDVTAPGQYDAVMRRGTRLKVTRSLREMRASLQSNGGPWLPPG